MFKLANVKAIGDIFWQDGAGYVDGTSEEVVIFKDKILQVSNCFWLEAEQIIEDTKTYYKRYTPSNECNRLYANIALALTGKNAPKIPGMLRHHDILYDNFCQNIGTGIFINNAQLLKKHTLECFLADGKYFHQYQRNRTLVVKEDGSFGYEQKFKAYLIVVVPPETNLPKMEFSIINHVHVSHLKNLI